MAGPAIYTDDGGGGSGGDLHLPPSLWGYVGGNAVRGSKLYIFVGGEAKLVFEDPASLQAPSSPSAVAEGDRDIRVSWTLETATEDRVVLEYSDDDAATWQEHPSANNLAPGTEEFLDQGNTNPTIGDGEERHYRVKVEADHDGGTDSSPYSTTVSAITDIHAPSLEAAAGVGKVTLDHPTGMDFETADQTEIQRRESGGTFSTLDTISGANLSAYEDTTVTGGVTYDYRIRWHFPDGTSDWSNTATATPTSSASPETLLPNDDRAVLSSDWTDADGDGEGWDELWDPDSGNISSSVNSGGSNTPSHTLHLDDPQEAHDATQTWEILGKCTSSSLFCGIAPANLTVELRQEGGVGLIATASIPTSGNIESYQLTQSEVDSIDMANLDGLYLRIEAPLNSVCCSNCSSQFPTFSTESIAVNYVAVDIS